MAKTVEALYSLVPQLKCKGLCSRTCGIILLQQEEYDRIAAVAPIPAKDSRIRETRDEEALTCPMLVKGRCSVHEVRPLICRLWGTIKAVRSGFHCQHGCRPERWLTDAEAHAIIDEAIRRDPKQRSLHADVDRELGGRL